MNIWNRIKGLMLRFLSHFWTGLEEAEPTASLVDAGTRMLKTNVSQGINDYEAAGQLADDIERLMKEADDAVPEAENNLDEATQAVLAAQSSLQAATSAVASLPVDATARQKTEAELALTTAQVTFDEAQLNQISAASQVDDARAIQAELREEYARSQGDLMQMRQIVHATDRQRTKGEAKGNRALMMDRANKVRSRFNGILEGYLNLGNNQESGMELVQRAYDREGRKASGIKHRSVIVRDLLKQRGADIATTERSQMKPSAKAILDEAMARATSQQTAKPADQSSNQAAS